ncbi:MAG: ribosome small subunit-dependent GTPase A [Pseudomonadota bacterium]
MNLRDFGYNDELERFIIANGLRDFGVGRIVSEQKEQYLVLTEAGEIRAEITGNLRFAAKGREDFPAVGDWVCLLTADPDFSLIQQILPRYSIISRRAVGKFGEIQIIATNIDFALLLQAVDRDFNLNRLERYLTICHSSGVKPIIVLTKTDLASEGAVAELIATISQRVDHAPVVAISNRSRDGYGALRELIAKGKTYCLLGSSGVGKSTLLNNLSGRDLMRTDDISQSSHKGRHVTSHRELIVLDNGGMLIDNPGMREVGVTARDEGLETTFSAIFSHAPHCKFQDCTHANETGCAVIAALNRGEIDAKQYESYLKLTREKAHFDSSMAERRKKDKDFGKMLKSYKKERKAGR